MNTTCTIAKYYRLSSEDDDVRREEKLESNSISNQRNLVESFISGTPELAGAPSFEYLDDGWSGKTFERPSVQKMLADVRNGKINCIIVKDFSRFGRDYLVVGNYISRVFPFLHVRFIAINDGFDSIRPVDADSMETSFKTLLYDLYSRDLSRKVRSAKLQRAKNGVFQSPFAPFGYEKDSKNKGSLTIDPKAAETVRIIFRMAADGVSAEKIARELNASGLLTQMMYKRNAECARAAWPNIGETNFWTRHSVAAILRDERYIGKAVYGKRAKGMIGGKRTIKNKRADWVIVEGAYPAIVTEEEFAAGSKRLRSFVERDDAVFHNRPLDRKVRCAVCGRVMERVNTREPYYYCCTPIVTKEFACPNERVSENEILEVLYKELLSRAQIVVDVNALRKECYELIQADRIAMQRILKNLNEDLVRQKKRMQDQYELFAGGKVGKDEYTLEMAGTAEKKAAIACKIRELEDRMRDAKLTDDWDYDMTDTSGHCSGLGELTKRIMPEVLECVLLHPGYRVEVVWKYKREEIPANEMNQIGF